MNFEFLVSSHYRQRAIDHAGDRVLMQARRPRHNGQGHLKNAGCARVSREAGLRGWVGLAAGGTPPTRRSSLILERRQVWPRTRVLCGVEHGARNSKLSIENQELVATGSVSDATSSAKSAILCGQRVDLDALGALVRAFADGSETVDGGCALRGGEVGVGGPAPADPPEIEIERRRRWLFARFEDRHGGRRTSPWAAGSNRRLSSRRAALEHRDGARRFPRRGGAVRRRSRRGHRCGARRGRERRCWRCPP